MIKKVLIIIFIFSISCKVSTGQGFDWQYSPRMPFSSPKLFLGLSAGAGILYHTGDFPFLEENLICCNFDNGTGTSLDFGINAEYWQQGKIAYGAALLLSIVPGSFKADVTEPTRDKDIRYEYEFTSQNVYAVIALSAKYRLFDSHLFLKGFIHTGFEISRKFDYKLRILWPPEEYFPDTGGRERNLSIGSIGPINKFLFMPGLQAGYDLNLGLGRYASPGLSVAYSLTNITENSDWKRLSVSVRIIVFFGM